MTEEEIFAAAAALPAEEQAAYLDSACAGRPELRARIEALLRSHEASGFMDQPTGVPSGAESLPKCENPPAEPAGARIGRYRLLQQIGEGGFGVVWMAEQVEPVTRRVALKIIKAGMDTREVIARFEAERQALAMMDHPNIARVLDAGATEQGRPFFVMELVKGIPITQFCDEQQFSTRQRLELFAEVCSAINHAHQKGVIHRDLKPSNVMVTLHGDKPVTKVIDFGIAKATQGRLTDRTLFTRFEQFVGTPAYMSPEQTALSGLDIDTRSDIYALGILLYELLTGKPPFDARTLLSAGYEEMRRIIREVEPPKPSTRLSTAIGEERTTLAKARQVAPEKLSRMVEPDLDWIVMKAIEKDRTRRYETANGLAMDIERFLTDEPVSAGPPAAGYRFRKFARRNRTALRVGAGIAAVLLAATAVSIWQAVRATSAEKLAEAKTTDEKVAREDAEAVSTFLTEVFQSPDPARDGRTITVAEMLDRAAKKLDAELATQPARKVRLQDALGRTYRALGLPGGAVSLAEKVRDYYAATFGPEHPETVGAMENLAESYTYVGRGDEALKIQEGVLALRRKLLGPEHPETLSAMHNLATFYFHLQRRPETAREMRENVVALRRKILGPEHPDTLLALQYLANSYASVNFRSSRGKIGMQSMTHEALRIREEVLTLTRKLHGPEHRDTLTALEHLAKSYAEAHFGRREGEALKLLEEVLAFHRKVRPEHPDTLRAMKNLASYYSRLGKPDGALKLREEGLALTRKVRGPEHSETFDVMQSLADSYSSGGRREDALKLREEVLALSRKLLGPEHADTLAALQRLAHAYSEAGREDDSLKIQKEIALTRKDVGLEHPETHLSVSSAEESTIPVTGVVLKQDGGFAASADVWLVVGDSDRTPQITRSLSDSDGRFRFLLPYDTMRRGARVSLLIGTRDHGLTPYNVRPEESRPLRIQLRESTEVEVLVVDQAGIPMPGVEAQPEQLFDAYFKNFHFPFPVDLARHFGQTSNDQGVCCFKNMPCNASLRLVIKDERFARTSFYEDFLLSEGPQSERQTITLLPAATLAGQVIFKESGQPVAGIRVGAQGVRNESTWGSVITDESGRYVMKQLRPGTCNVALDLARAGLQEDWTARAHENVTVSAGEHLTDVNFELIAGVVITGRVVARDTGEPVPDVDIAVYGPAHPRSSAWVQATVTKSDGRYLLRVPPGAQYVYFRRAPPEFDRPNPASHVIEVTDGESRTLNFELPRREESRVLEEKFQAEQEKEANALPPLAEIQPKHLSALRNRAHHLAQKGKWKAADDDLRTALRLDPNVHDDWYSLAPLLLQTGDVEGYSRHRQAMLEKFQSAADLNVLERTVKAGLLLPAENAELGTIARLADTLATGGKDHPDLPFFQFAKALAEYRHGHFAESAALAKQALASPGVKFRDIQANATLAMAEQRLDHRSEALAALAKADELAKDWPNVDASDPHVNFGRDWKDTLMGTFLLREARTLLDLK